MKRLETNPNIIGEKIQEDLVDIRQRLTKYKQLAVDADMVVITLVCSDSRAVLPETIVPLKMKNGVCETLFIGVPTIGGGYPSKSRIRGVIKVLTEWGVDEKKLRIVATQHGNTKEVLNATKKPQTREQQKVTCGLRQFIEQYRPELSEIKSRLIPWANWLKQKQNDVKVAPDRLPLEYIEEKYPELMELVNSLHTKTGLPRRLIIRAAYRNTSFDIADNELSVLEKICEYLRDPEYASIYGTCFVAAALLDHQRKRLHFIHPHADLETEESIIEFPQLQSRDDEIQNPETVIISFGQDAICLHNGVLLPHIAGNEETHDNVFRACASIPSVPTLMCAVAEAYYAVVHKVHPHAGDLNFSTLQKVIIVCDNDDYVNVVREALRSKEFEDEYLEVFAALSHSIVMINLNVDAPERAAEYHEVMLR